MNDSFGHSRIIDRPLRYLGYPPTAWPQWPKVVFSHINNGDSSTLLARVLDALAALRACVRTRIDAAVTASAPVCVSRVTRSDDVDVVTVLLVILVTYTYSLLVYIHIHIPCLCYWCRRCLLPHTAWYGSSSRVAVTVTCVNYNVNE